MKTTAAQRLLLSEYFELFPWPVRERNMVWFLKEHPEFAYKNRNNLQGVRSQLLVAGVLKPCNLEEKKKLDTMRAKRAKDHAAPVHPAFDIIKIKQKVQNHYSAALAARY